jgi:hypothetical protein
MICSDPEEDPKPPTVNHKEARRLRDKLRKRKQRKNIKERAFLGEVPQDDSFAEVAVARISDRETTSILGIVDNPLDNPPEAVGKTIAMAKTIAMVDKNLEVMSPERPCKIRKICGGVMPPGTYYIGDPSYVLASPSYVLGTPWTRAENSRPSAREVPVTQTVNLGKRGEACRGCVDRPLALSRQ